MKRKEIINEIEHKVETCRDFRDEEAKAGNLVEARVYNSYIDALRWTLLLLKNGKNEA